MGKELKKELAEKKKKKKKSDEMILKKEENLKKSFWGRIWIKLRESNKLVKFTVFSPLIALTLFGGYTLLKVTIFELNFLVNPESFFSVEMEDSDVEYDYFCKTCGGLVALNPNTLNMEMTLIDIPFQFKIQTNGGIILNDINVYYRSDKYKQQLSSVSYSNPVLVDPDRALKINNSGDGKTPSVIPVLGYAISDSGGTQKVTITKNTERPYFERTDLSTCSKNEGCYLGIMHYYGDDEKHFGYNIIEFSDTSVANKKYLYIILHFTEGKNAKYEIYKLESFDIEKLDAFLIKNGYENSDVDIEDEYSKIKYDIQIVKEKNN